MKQVQLLIIVLFSMLLTISCAKKEKQSNGKQNSENTQTLQLAPVTPDSVLILGIWKAESKKGISWFEFRGDGTCANGRNGTLKNETLEYKMNADKKELIIYLESGAKRFEYELKEKELHVKMDGKNKAIRFDRIDQRP